jgi:transposase
MHLRRDFQAMIDRSGNGERIGRRVLSLLIQSIRYGHKLRDGTLSWSVSKGRMRSLRREVMQTPLDGSKCRCVKMAMTRYEFLEVEEGIWNFACVNGVVPTGNAVGQALRHVVI